MLTTASHTNSRMEEMYFMSSYLTDIVALVMTMTRGGSKRTMGKEIVTGTVAVKIDRITS